MPSTSVSFNDMALVSEDLRYVIVPDDDVELAARLEPFYDRYFHQHPLITHASVTPAPERCDSATYPVGVPGGGRTNRAPDVRDRAASLVTSHCSLTPV